MIGEALRNAKPTQARQAGMLRSTWTFSPVRRIVGTLAVDFDS